MKKILVTGSTAFDTLMHYNGSFSESFPNGDIQAGLNMSLLLDKLEKFHGGTGLNICYNLALTGEDPILLTSVGHDFSFDGIVEEKVILDYVHREMGYSTANGFTVRDNEQNAMTFFHAGAMNKAELAKVFMVREEIEFAIVSADKKEAMIEHIVELSRRDIPIFFDPAQQITVFEKEELLPLLDMCHYLFVNQFEFVELKKKLSYDDEMMMEKFDKIIVTYGAEGSQLLEQGAIYHIPAVKTDEYVDDTGAGDALRAWVLRGLKTGLNWKTSLQIGTIMARYCVENHGSQNHFFNLWVIMADMEEYFGVKVDLYERKGIREY